MTTYQSPIVLNKNKTKFFNQPIYINGTNTNSIYDEIDKVFYIQHDKVILTINCVKYKLIEYHFHIPSEHSMNSKTHNAEIHYVFVELGSTNKKFNLCSEYSCINNINGGIIVIGKIIHNIDKICDLSKLQVSPPKYYYEYDGLLTTGDFSPVRWIFDDTSIYINIAQLINISKSNRELQPDNNRIIIYAKNKS